MGVHVSGCSISFFAAGGVLEDDEEILLALLQDRIDAKCFSVERKDQRSRRDLVGGHAEDVGDRNLLRRLIRLEVRLHPKSRIEREVIETLEGLPSFAARISHPNAETVAG